MASFEESETTVTGIQADRCYYIGSNRQKHISRLNREVEAGRAELITNENEWAQYRVHEKNFDPLTGFKRQVNMSDEQRQAAAERLAKARDNK
ncbi:hypothetical protein ACTXIU_17570 [Glutamicibacter arilaitensis]|uniref:hypothetical protein n=1 Tax=Glutamicibacter arilaitensis TaxID=256701 RepID=UPI003F917FC4